MTADSENDSELSTVEALDAFRREGQPLAQVTVSSDAYGSFPSLDENGTVIGYGVGKPDSLLFTLRTLVLERGWPLAEALPLFTSSPARIYKFGTKGHLEAGADGDVLVLDAADLSVRYVFARARAVKTLDWVKRCMFEA